MIPADLPPEPVLAPPTVERRHSGWPLLLLIVLSLLTLVVVGLFASYGYPAIVDSRDASVESRRQGEISACRGRFRADIDDANGRVAAGQAQLVLLAAEALGALDSQPGLDSRVAAASAELQAGLDAQTQANAAYRAAAALSASDPEAFLASC